MDNHDRPRLPTWAIILDVIGTLLLVLGVVALVGRGDGIFGEFVDSQAFSIVLIFAGVLLMLPLIVVLIRRTASQRRF